MSLEIIVDKPDRLPERLAERFEGRAREALAARGRFALALPGGSVAQSCFPRLAACPLDWSRIDFFWGDERAVAASDPDSNYGLFQSLWLDKIQLPPERIHRMRGEREDQTAAAVEYEVDLLRTLGNPPQLDLVILGVGPDGHVCSLFPGSSLLLERTRWVAAIHGSPKPPPRRLTLTLPALLAARDIVVMATGTAKAEVMKAALEDPASELPVALVGRGAPSSLFLLDPDAARLLTGGRQ
jgi:6-phosphogluconolactonase